MFQWLGRTQCERLHRDSCLCGFDPRLNHTARNGYATNFKELLMRLIRIFLLAACPLVLVAQPAETDQRVLQTLLSEVRQLRAAIERSTLLGVRTQLAISQLQLQESK